MQGGNRFELLIERNSGGLIEFTEPVGRADAQRLKYT